MKKGLKLLEDKYIGSQIPMKCICEKHNEIFMLSYNHLQYISGCRYCSGYEKHQIDYIDEIKIKQPHIEVVGKYNGCENLVRVRCKIDGYEWM